MLKNYNRTVELNFEAKKLQLEYNYYNFYKYITKI